MHPRGNQPNVTLALSIAPCPFLLRFNKLHQPLNVQRIAATKRTRVSSSTVTCNGAVLRGHCGKEGRWGRQGFATALNGWVVEWCVRDRVAPPDLSSKEPPATAPYVQNIATPAIVDRATNAPVCQNCIRRAFAVLVSPFRYASKLSINSLRHRIVPHGAVWRSKEQVKGVWCSQMGVVQRERTAPSTPYSIHPRYDTDLP